MEGRLRDTRRQSHAQTQAERCFEGFVVLRPLSLVRPKSSRCVSTMAHVSPLTSHLLSPRRLPLGNSTPGDPSPDMDLERGGQIAESQRHIPEKTVHRSRRGEHPPVFPLLGPVRSTPPRPDPRMVRGTVRTSPHPQRLLDGPSVATGGQTPTHAQHHKALLKIVTKSNRPLFPRLLPLVQAARRDPRDDLRHQGPGRTPTAHVTAPTGLVTPV